MADGWECPRCHAVYAPWVNTCGSCSGVRTLHPQPGEVYPILGRVPNVAYDLHCQCNGSNLPCPVHNATGFGAIRAGN